MNRRILSYLLFILLLASSPLFAEEPESRSFWDTNFFLSGQLRQETAYRITSPVNFSKIKGLAHLDMKFVFSDQVKMRLAGRAWGDIVYDVTHQYPSDVRDNMRKEATLRDAYFDFTFPQINLRIGHQQIVWGEALGQAFADVVTPRDLREFNLPSFDEMRLPIWAIDAQFNLFSGWNLEIVISPDQKVDKLALPGSDFSFRIPVPPGINTVLLDDNRPKTNFRQWNGGAKLSALIHGWDLSWFYYTSPDHVPSLAKTTGVDSTTGLPVLFLEPIHRRIHNVGVTVSKGWDTVIARGEFVYTVGRPFNSVTPTVDQGLQEAGQLRYVLGADYDVLGKGLINAEFQQEVILEHRNKISDDKLRNWFFVRAQASFLNKKLTPSVAFIVGLDHGDTQLSPRIDYDVTGSITLSWGADIFSGPEEGLYGEFDSKDRIYMTTRWMF